MVEETTIDLTGDGGVKKKIVKEGVGDETPLLGCTVSVHYTAKHVDGRVFDSSLRRNEPFQFRLGAGNCIKAFDIGVGSMKRGEKCILTCAPNYAYGKNGSPPDVPPNSTLIFEIECLNWKGEDVSPNSDGSIQKFVLVKSDKRMMPNDGAFVKVHLIGKYENRIFEERDVTFNVGEGQEFDVVEGVEFGLLKIHLDETSRLLIAPKYAFGSKGHDEFQIPPNATVEYIIKLIDCERAIEEWKLDKEESLKEAKCYKEKGNNYLKREKYTLANKMYNKSLNYLSNCDNDESKRLKVATHLNIALCNQKIGEFFEAKSSCNSALEIDPTNIKGLYRRGQCYLSLGDFDKALEDFQILHEIDPNNKAAINQITICKQKIREFHEQEKKVYANMFTKFAAVDNQKDQANRDDDDQPDVLSSCGEWTEEEARREVDRAFERDNNIIMLN